VRDSWDARVRRAEALAGHPGAAQAMIAFYAGVLRLQRGVYEALERQPPSGDAAVDLERALFAVPQLTAFVQQRGPELLARESHVVLQRGAYVETMLAPFWRDRPDTQFFAKTLLQPYAQWLIAHGLPVPEADRPRTGIRCPRCGGRPQLSILLGAGTPGGAIAQGAAALESGGRQLQCANCLGCWPLGRVRCASCGEEDEAKLGYFQSEQLPHLRLDSCNTCRRYLKTIDLGRDGLAVPVVDEVAGVALDAWAADRGYEKIELNLVGM